MTIREECVEIAGSTTRWLSVEGHGGDEAILLVHGYTDSADTWRPVLDVLAADGRAAAAVDLPGHGAAGPADGVACLADLDAFVVACIEKSDQGEGVVVVGSSLGALLALRADGHPQVRGVVALAPPLGSINPGFRILPRAGSALGAALPRLPVPDRLVTWALGHGLVLACSRGRVDGGQRRALSQHLTRRRVGGLLQLGSRIVPEIHNARHGWNPTGNVPVTVWWGTGDLVCGRPPAGIDVTVEPGAAHCPQWTNPHGVARLVHELGPFRPQLRAS